MRKAPYILLVLLAAVSAWPLMPMPAQAQQQAETISRCRSEGVSSVVISTSSAANNELVALTAGQRVHVCGYQLVGGGTVGVQFITGTGTACATNEADLTGVIPLAANTSVAVTNAGATQFKGASASALCIELSDAVSVQGHMTYVKY